jgi:hypothetical protein
MKFQGTSPQNEWEQKHRFSRGPGGMRRKYITCVRYYPVSGFTEMGQKLIIAIS